MAHAGAVAEWRKLLGPTDSDVARQEAPGTIRALFGTDKTQNACHGSDAPQTAKQECDFFFRQKVCNTVSNPALCSSSYDPTLQWCEAQTFLFLFPGWQVLGLSEQQLVHCKTACHSSKATGQHHHCHLGALCRHGSSDMPFQSRRCSRVAGSLPGCLALERLQRHRRGPLFRCHLFGAWSSLPTHSRSNLTSQVAQVHQ